MKILDLNFTSRLRLSNALSQIDKRPMAILGMLYEVFKQVRFSEAEWAQIKIEDKGNQRAFIPPPDAEFAKIRVELEDAHAQALLREFEEGAILGVIDMEWAEKAKEQLK
jgi:hypothetical protein